MTASSYESERRELRRLRGVPEPPASIPYEDWDFPENRVSTNDEVPLPESVWLRREAWRTARWYRLLIPLAWLGRAW
jgi:hypothetical protein